MQDLSIILRSGTKFTDAYRTAHDRLTAGIADNTKIVQDGVKGIIGVSGQAQKGLLNLVMNTPFSEMTFGLIDSQRTLQDLVDTAAKWDVFKFAQGILGLAIGAGALAAKFGGLLFFFPKIGTFIGGLLTKLPLIGPILGKLGGTAAKTGAQLGGGFSKMLASTGKGLGTFIATIGTGAGKAIQGILSGIGMGLAALGTALTGPQGLVAAAAIVVLTGAMIGMGYAAKLLGEGLGAAAPAITALMGGVAESLRVTMGAFKEMEVGQILATAAALPLLGIGFATMAGGIVAGIGILTAGELLNKVASFFGLSSGEGIGDRVAHFVEQIAGVGPVMQQLASSGLAGQSKIVLPVPVFEHKIDFDKIAQVKAAYASISDVISLAERAAALPQEIALPAVRVNPDELRETMAQAAPLSVEGEHSNHVLDRLDQMVALLSQLVAGRSSGGGSILGNLIASGGLR